MSSRKGTCVNTLTTYFNKKIKTTHDGNIGNETSTSNSLSTAITQITTDKSPEKSLFNDMAIIGCCFDQKVSELKYKLVTNAWMPDEKFKFTISGYRYLKFQLNWIKRFPRLCYTNMQDSGAVCKYCAIFHHNFTRKGAHEKPGVLVTKPFINGKMQ